MKAEEGMTRVGEARSRLARVAMPDAFASGTPWTTGTGPAAEAVPRCRAFRLPDPSFEPSFEEFRPF